jgi:threonine dehydrogenase-like Zn-dependent dehydrogenase
MKALVNTAPQTLELLTWPDPQPGPGQVRIRTRAVGICATDLEMIKGWERTGFPSIPGHEWFGVVDSLGVGVDPAMCGACCVAENILPDGGEVGFEHPGGYGQFFVTLAENLRLLPRGFPAQRGILIEPLAVGVRCLRRLRPQDLRTALVLGDGPVGLLILMLLRQAGVETVVQVGGRSGRLKLAAELGATVTLDHRQFAENLDEQLRAIAPAGFANVVEASGSGSGARSALEAAGKGAHMVIMGDYAQQRADFRWNTILHKEIELMGSNASAGGWDEAVRLAQLDGVFGQGMDRLVSHRFLVEDYRAAFALVREAGENMVKVMLDWGAGTY